MSDELKIGYGRFDPNPLTEAQRAIMSAIPLVTSGELRESMRNDLATLRAQLADALRERDAAQANVAVLREVTTELELTVRVLGLDSEPLARMADNARNALEATK